MKIAICDDYPQFAYELEKRIEKICARKDWPLESLIFTSPKKLLASDLGATQAIFLDIDMPEMNGLETARELRLRYPEMIIVFVTAFIEYAPEGYHVSAFRYLLKQYLDRDLALVLDDIQQMIFESKERIEIVSKPGSETVFISDILYLEGTQNRKTLFHLTHGETPIEAAGKLSDYETVLKDKGFLRIQRSFVVNMYHVGKISNYTVYMRNGEALKTKKESFKEINAQFLQWKGQHL